MDELWKSVDTSPPWTPRWVNAPNQPAFANGITSTPAKLVIEGDVLYFKQRSMMGGPIFILLLVVGVVVFSFFKNATNQPIFFVAAAGGALVSCVFFALALANDRLGDYLIVDTTTQRLTLPRQQMEFEFSEVECFQWICGPPTGQSDSATKPELYLLVKANDHPIRYTIKQYPDRKSVRQAVRFSGLLLEELQLGLSRGSRHQDANTVRA